MMIVAGGLLWRHGRILVGRRRPGKPYPGYWEFPGGKLEQGETLQQCVVREFFEELNLVVSAGSLVSENIYEYPSGPVQIKIFEVFCPSGEPKMLEHDLLDWVKPNELINLGLLPGNLSVVAQIENYFRDREGSRDTDNFSRSSSSPT